MNLYTLSKEMQNIVSMGYDETETAEMLEAYHIVAEDKIDDIVKAIKTLEATKAGYMIEASRLTEVAKKMQKTADSLEAMIDRYMRSTGTDKIDTSIAKVYFIKSEGVIVHDENALEKEYMRIVPETSDPDKVKIKADIKKGIIVTGASIEVRQNLQIK